MCRYNKVSSDFSSFICRQKTYLKIIYTYIHNNSVVIHFCPCIFRVATLSQHVVVRSQCLVLLYPNAPLKAELALTVCAVLR